MTYTLITANRNYSSWSLRPWVLMMALGIPFQDRIEPFTAAVNYEAFRAFAMCGVTEMHGGFSALRNQCPMNVGVRVQMAPHDAALRKDVARITELFTQGLDVGAGQVWVDHILAHPAMQQWEQEALAESWREESHETEVGETGVITADYRTG